MTYRFTCLYVGWPGTVHDPRVFSNSMLRAVVEAGLFLTHISQFYNTF